MRIVKKSNKKLRIFLLLREKTGSVPPGAESGKKGEKMGGKRQGSAANSEEAQIIAKDSGDSEKTADDGEK